MPKEFGPTKRQKEVIKRMNKGDICDFLNTPLGKLYAQFGSLGINSNFAELALPYKRNLRGLNTQHTHNSIQWVNQERIEVEKIHGNTYAIRTFRNSSDGEFDGQIVALEIVTLNPDGQLDKNVCSYTKIQSDFQL